MVISLKIRGEVMSLERLTLGHARTLRAEFGVKNIAELDVNDPDVLAGMVYLLVAETHPEWEPQRTMNYVNDIALDEVDAVDDEPAADPTQAVAEPAGEALATS